MIKYLGVLLIFVTGEASHNIKIFYNKNGEITIPELATHYRLGSIDLNIKKFKGHVTEFDLNERPFLELNYDTLGVKNGHFKYNGFGLLLEGEFENNAPKTSVPDSIMELISKKERFVQSIYIRKRDYPEIKNILSPVPQSSDSAVYNRTVFKIVEDPPSFPGGMTAISQFVAFHLVYPKADKEKGIKGRVFVEFIIKQDGTVDNIKVVKGIGGGCDESAAFAISKLPDWKPGYQRGKPVQIKMVLPITFQ